jgi:hypothetical protein
MLSMEVPALLRSESHASAEPELDGLGFVFIAQGRKLIDVKKWSCFETPIHLTEAKRALDELLVEPSPRSHRKP